MAAVALPFSSRRIVIRESLRHYKPGWYPGTIGSHTWIFPQTFLPSYVVRSSRGVPESLPVRQQVYWSWVIFHATHIGDYREIHEEKGEERVYERLY